MFSKNTLDTFEDASYYYATFEQLRMMSRCDKPTNKNTIIRINDLVQTTSFKEHYPNTDLMFNLFTDDELQGIDFYTGYYFNYFKETPEMLDKAMDLFKRKKKAIRNISRLTPEVFMQIDNDILLEIYEYIIPLQDEEWIKFKVSTLKSKSMIKRIFKRK